MSAKLDEFKEFVKRHPLMKTMVANKEKHGNNCMRIIVFWVKRLFRRKKYGNSQRKRKTGQIVLDNRRFNQKCDGLY